MWCLQTNHTEIREVKYIFCIVCLLNGDILLLYNLFPKNSKYIIVVATVYAHSVGTCPSVDHVHSLETNTVQSVISLYFYVGSWDQTRNHVLNPFRICQGSSYFRSVDLVPLTPI